MVTIVIYNRFHCFLCTHSQRKYQLVCDCIHYLGTAKVLELYHETAEIQENGGQITADGKTR